MANIRDMQKELDDFRNDATKKQEQEKQTVFDRVKKHRLLLEKCGARKLFEEMRDKGIVKSVQMRYEVDGPVVFLKKIFTGIDYVPATIKEGWRNDDTGYSIPNLNVNVDAYIQLWFSYDPSSCYTAGFAHSHSLVHNGAHDYLAFCIDQNGELYFAFRDYCNKDDGCPTNNTSLVGNCDIYELVTEVIKKNISCQ